MMSDVWQEVDQETLDNGGYAAIINEAKNRNLLPSNIDLTNGENVIAVAKQLIEMAYDSYIPGSEQEDVNTILRMAGVEMGKKKESQPLPSAGSTIDNKEETPAQEDTSSAEEKKEEKPKPKNGRRKKKTSEPEPDSLEKATEYKGLPVPEELEGDYPKMPLDITAISDLEVRRLYAQFGAVLSRTHWVLAQYRSQLARAERMKDLTYAEALRKAQGPNAESRKAEAQLDSEHVKWDEESSKQKNEVFYLTALRDVFSGNVERLSREMTMRQEERVRVTTGG